MKKLCLLFILAVCTITVTVAQYPNYNNNVRPAVLQIVASDQKLLQIKVNNTDYYNEWASQHVFNNIYPSNYFVTILKLDSNFTIGKPIYKGYLAIQEGMRCKITIDAANKYSVQYFPLPYNVAFQLPPNWNGNNPWPQQLPNPGYPVNMVVLSNEELQALLKEMKEQWADNAGMIKTIKRFARSRMFEADQVVQVVKQFRFADDQLECAKLLYKYTEDKFNYSKVADALTFNSSKQDLYDYINKQDVVY